MMMLDLLLMASHLLDIIGYVYTYFDMYDHKTKSDIFKRRMNLQACDSEKHHIYFKLWESYAKKMDKFMSKKEEGIPVFFILQNEKFSFSSGRAYVSSSFHGSTLYINDDLEEIIAFRNSLLEKYSEESVSSRRLVLNQYVTNIVMTS